MRTRCRASRWLWLALTVFAAGLLALPVFGQAGPGPAAGDLARTPLPPDPPPATAAATPYPLMRPDRATLERWIALHEAAPEAYIPPEVKSGRKRLAAGSFSLLPLLDYIPAERNQGGCGDCWQWAGTGVVEIALNVQKGIRDRLSVQHVSSCYNGGSNDGCVCCGGWMTMLADFYEQQGYALPWSNANAAWGDGGRWCSDSGACSNASVSCGAISDWPQYPIGLCNVVGIPTTGLGQEQAIANIKAVLHQNKAIFFAFFLPDSEEWNKFGSFWGNQPESAVFNPNSACGKPWGSGGAGHAVLCVGYDDTDPNNPYWIMLNSWGASSNRPNGLFRVSMNMDYDCIVGSFHAFYWETLDILFDAVTPTPTTQPECEAYYAAQCDWTDRWTTNGYGNALEFYSCSGWYESGPEYVYSYTPTEAGWMTLSLSELQADLDLFVLDGAARCSPADCLAYGDNDVTFWAEAGHRYYFVVDGYHGASGGYALAFWCESSSTATPTLTPTRSPTPTRTLTPTRTASPTPSRTGSPPIRWVWIREAESGARAAPMTAASDPGASACEYVYSPENSAGDVTYSFSVPAAANYYPWARTMGGSFTQNSFYVSFDGGAEFHYEAPQVGGAWAWGWNRVYPVDTAPTAYWLAAGAHTLRIRAREPYARLDAVALTDDAAYAIAAFTPCGPTPTPSATIPATPTPTGTVTATPSRTATRTITPTPTPEIPVYYSVFEAEDGQVLPFFSAAPDQTASGCNYIYTIENSLGTASFTFYVPYAGNHYLWARSMGLSYTQNSFYVSFDGGVEFHYEIPQYGGQWTWHWNRVYRVDTTPAPVFLGQGWHTVAFRGRETYARLDAICVVNNASYTPDFTNPCAATYTPSPTWARTPTPTPTWAHTMTPTRTRTVKPADRGLWLPAIMA